jgi:hypothetical protein
VDCEQGSSFERDVCFKLPQISKLSRSKEEDESGIEISKVVICGGRFGVKP